MLKTYLSLLSRLIGMQLIKLGHSCLASLAQTPSLLLCASMPMGHIFDDNPTKN